MAKVTFNIPTKPKHARKVHVQEATGTVAYFQIGNERVKFVLQHDRCGKPNSLVHYASGYVFGRLNEAKVRHLMTAGSYARMSDRRAAETLIARAIDRLGADQVLATLASVP